MNSKNYLVSLIYEKDEFYELVDQEIEEISDEYAESLIRNPKGLYYCYYMTLSRIADGDYLKVEIVEDFDKLSMKLIVKAVSEEDCLDIVTDLEPVILGYC